MVECIVRFILVFYNSKIPVRHRPIDVDKLIPTGHGHIIKMCPLNEFVD